MGDWERAVSYTIFFFAFFGLYSSFSTVWGQEGEEINPKNYLNITVLPVTATMARAPKGDMN